MRNGFSLIEILIATAIAAVLVTILATVLVKNTGLFYKQTTLVKQGVSLNDVLSEIDDSIKQSSGIATSYPSVNPIYTTNSQTLILEVPSYNSSGVIANIYDYIVFAKDTSNANILRMIVYPNALSARSSQNVVLTSLLSNIQFEYLDNTNQSISVANASSVKTSLSLLYKTSSADKSETQSIITTLKNL